MAQIIDGKKMATAMLKKMGAEIAKLKKRPPSLVVILVGANRASRIYVQNKHFACKKIGITSKIEHLPTAVSQAKLLKKIEKYNRDDSVDGILLQLPLPKQIDEKVVFAHIDPTKDVDGLHPYNLGALYSNRPGLKPCTPQGILKLIESTGIEIAGKNTLVVGRSLIVGRPVATLLTWKNATVTLCGTRTEKLPEKIKTADIVVVAIGKPKFVQGNWIKPGAVVIDVGINRLKNGVLVGDVDFEAAQKKAGFITPVPGGVGPMTIAMLLQNTLKAYGARNLSRKNR